jgi:hypothetical protein
MFELKRRHPKTLEIFRSWVALFNAQHNPEG